MMFRITAPASFSLLDLTFLRIPALEFRVALISATPVLLPCSLFSQMRQSPVAKMVVVGRAKARSGVSSRRRDWTSVRELLYVLA